MEAQVVDLKKRLAKIADLGGAAGLLQWDQQVKMPRGSVQTRADQLSTLGGLAHEYFVDEEMGALLEELQPYGASLPYDSDEASLIRVKWRDYQKLIKVPTSLVMELLGTAAVAQPAWQKAREENDFKQFEPHLEKIVDIQIRVAEALGYQSDNPYDALIDNFESDLTFAYINSVFSALKPKLVDLIKAIQERGKPVDDGPLHREFDEDKQIEFSKRIAEALGYSFHNGRLDKSAHPFTGASSYHDVRITTRVAKNFLPTCLMSVIHEAGHGMHGQGLRPELYRSTIEFGGLATAESQSRFYENVLCRSRAFWKLWYPELQKTFPQMADVDLETFYRALNKVEPGLIRVEADEVTYGLHIMLRFELENEMINNKVKVADLPQIWNDRMEASLGVRPKTDADGVLQDIHWSNGYMGYFPDYLLGSMFASQLWKQMQKDNPKVMSEIEKGEYANIKAWHKAHIHDHGAKFTFPELAEKATGSALQAEPYVEYLTTKYNDIYAL
jgi:carboxypeptidase Taq